MSFESPAKKQAKKFVQSPTHLRDDLSGVGLVGVLDELDGELEVVAAVHAAALELQCECKGISVRRGTV